VARDREEGKEWDFMTQGRHDWTVRENGPESLDRFTTTSTVKIVSGITDQEDSQIRWPRVSSAAE
jgi:hypothetical protein